MAILFRTSHANLWCAFGLLAEELGVGWDGRRASGAWHTRSGGAREHESASRRGTIRRREGAQREGEPRTGRLGQGSVGIEHASRVGPARPGRLLCGGARTRRRRRIEVEGSRAGGESDRRACRDERRARIGRGSGARGWMDARTPELAGEAGRVMGGVGVGFRRGLHRGGSGRRTSGPRIGLGQERANDRPAWAGRHFGGTGR